MVSLILLLLQFLLCINIISNFTNVGIAYGFRLRAKHFKGCSVRAAFPIKFISII
jgi:hypothetical protein